MLTSSWSKAREEAKAKTEEEAPRKAQAPKRSTTGKRGDRSGVPFKEKRDMSDRPTQGRRPGARGPKKGGPAGR